MDIHTIDEIKAMSAQERTSLINKYRLRSHRGLYNDDNDELTMDQKLAELRDAVRLVRADRMAKGETKTRAKKVEAFSLEDF